MVMFGMRSRRSFQNSNHFSFISRSPKSSHAGYTILKVTEMATDMRGVCGGGPNSRSID